MRPPVGDKRPQLGVVDLGSRASFRSRDHRVDFRSRDWAAEGALELDCELSLTTTTLLRDSTLDSVSSPCGCAAGPAQSARGGCRAAAGPAQSALLVDTDLLEPCRPPRAEHNREQGREHGLEHGQGPGPDHGVTHGSEHGTDCGPEHGPENSLDRGPEDGSQHDLQHGPQRGLNCGHVLGPGRGAEHGRDGGCARVQVVNTSADMEDRGDVGHAVRAADDDVSVPAEPETRRRTGSDVAPEPEAVGGDARRPAWACAEEAAGESTCARISGADAVPELVDSRSSCAEMDDRAARQYLYDDVDAHRALRRHIDIFLGPRT